MSASAAIIGNGTTIGYQVYPASGSSYTTLGELVDTNTPGEKVDDVEVTNYTSPNTHKEFRPGWIEGEDVELETNYLTADQVVVNGIVGVMKTWRITLPDTHTWTWSGYINKRSNAVPNKDKINQKIGIKVADKPIYA
jgi:hypothetical protein